ncbi:unnamed protein product [Amoebophrya sp. A25]|nr:unnamed protein product [Amoebophrya sp. A25]|eukprot:GSA25T00021073001.1
MGRSNGCEANRKREDAKKRAAKFNKEGNSQLQANADCMSLQCKVCLQSFMSTQLKMAKIHYEQKHAKLPWEECFPAHPKPE